MRALRLKQGTVLLILTEALLVYGAIICSVYLRVGFRDASLELVTKYGYWKAAVAALLCLAGFYLFDLYDFPVMQERRELVLRLIQALGLVWIVLAISFYTLPWLMLSRGVSLIALPLALMLMVGWRVLIHRFEVRRIFRKKVRIRRPPGFLFLLFVQFFYSRKAVEEVFKPMLADWRFEYYESLKEDRLAQARWTSFRWMIRFIFAMGVTQLIAFLRDFVPFGRARN